MQTQLFNKWFHGWNLDIQSPVSRCWDKKILYPIDNAKIKHCFGVFAISANQCKLNRDSTAAMQSIWRVAFMHSGKYIFSQVMDFSPWHTFNRCVHRYREGHKVLSFRCSQPYRALAVAQLNRWFGLCTVGNQNINGWNWMPVSTLFDKNHYINYLLSVDTKWNWSISLSNWIFSIFNQDIAKK